MMAVPIVGITVVNIRHPPAGMVSYRRYHSTCGSAKRAGMRAHHTIHLFLEFRPWKLPRMVSRGSENFSHEISIFCCHGSQVYVPMEECTCETFHGC